MVGKRGSDVECDYSNGAIELTLDIITDHTISSDRCTIPPCGNEIMSRRVIPPMDRLMVIYKDKEVVSAAASSINDTNNQSRDNLINIEVMNECKPPRSPRLTSNETSGASADSQATLSDSGTSNKKRKKHRSEEDPPVKRLGSMVLKATGSGRRRGSKRKQQQQQRLRSEQSKKSKSANRARKALRTITIILGAFVLCWTPWHVLSMIMGFCQDDKGDQTCVPDILYDISYWLCYLNSPINPLCYALVNQQFKRTFIRILKMDWHRT